MLDVTLDSDFLYFLKGVFHVNYLELPVEQTNKHLGSGKRTHSILVWIWITRWIKESL